MTKLLPVQRWFVPIAVPPFFITGYAVNAVIIVENKLL